LNQEKPQTIFAISSAMKGEGKTVTALNLAFTAAKDFGKETLLVEGDFKNPTISAYLKAKPQSNLIDVLLSGADINSSIVRFGHHSLSVLPVIQSVRNSSGILNSQEMRSLVATLKQRYNFILIDSPPILSLSDMNILERIVDGIILVVRADSTPVDVVVKAVNSLVTDKLLGIVLNDAKQPMLQYPQYYYGKNGVKVP
jgi:non-specific protein-tyrosine kinase